MIFSSKWQGLLSTRSICPRFIRRFLEVMLCGLQYRV